MLTQRNRRYLFYAFSRSFLISLLLVVAVFGVLSGLIYLMEVDNGAEIFEGIRPLFQLIALLPALLYYETAGISLSLSNTRRIYLINFLIMTLLLVTLLTLVTELAHIVWLGLIRLARGQAGGAYQYSWPVVIDSFGRLLAISLFTGGLSSLAYRQKKTRTSGAGLVGYFLLGLVTYFIVPAARILIAGDPLGEVIGLIVASIIGLSLLVWNTLHMEPKSRLGGVL